MPQLLLSEHMNAPTTREAWVAVRSTPDNERTEWLDLNTLASLEELVAGKITSVQELVPTWDDRYPVLRIARVMVTEVPG